MDRPCSRRVVGLVRVEGRAGPTAKEGSGVFDEAAAHVMDWLKPSFRRHWQ